jgi:hypothetical protein
MDKFIRRFNVKCFATSADIALLVSVHPKPVVEKSHQHVTTDVELSPVV